MSEAQIWLAVGIVLLILEIITPGYVLANFGVAAIGSAIAAWLGADLLWQVIVFIALSLISFVTVRPLLMRTLIKDTVPTGADALIGRSARVIERIPMPPENGRVQIDGDNWLATSVDGNVIEEGAVVTVKRVESIKLFVERQS